MTDVQKKVHFVHNSQVHLGSSNKQKVQSRKTMKRHTRYPWIFRLLTVYNMKPALQGTTNQQEEITFSVPDCIAQVQKQCHTLLAVTRVLLDPKHRLPQ